jgi:hypothetical protein
MSSQFAPPPYGGNTVDISDLALPLAQGKGWIKFLAIVQIVFAALYVLISFGIGLLVAWLPIWLGILLLQTAGAIERAQQQGDAEALKLALGKLKLYFVIQAIAMIVGFALGILGVIAAIAFGLSMHNFGHFPH